MIKLNDVGMKHVDNARFLPRVGELIAQGHTVTINVRGRSMRPFLEDNRDKVTLAPAGVLAVGDAVLACDYADHYVLHRIVEIQGDRITLMGDGNCIGTESCMRSDVLGVVETYIHPHHSFSAQSRWLRFSVRVWRCLLPVRRYMLWIYRAYLKMRNIILK